MEDATIEIENEPVSPPAGEQWRRDRADKEYVPRKNGRGVIYRKGEETVDAAYERDAKPKDKRPRKKPQTPKKPPAARETDLRELEKLLVEAFKSPAIVCASFGDEWAADHFTSRGPYLARNLVLASEHNPWLRRKLEEMAAGGDIAMNMISLVGVAGALALYLIPPTVYFLNLPMNPKARKMLDIPDRRENAPSPPTPASPIVAEPIAA